MGAQPSSEDRRDRTRSPVPWERGRASQWRDPDDQRAELSQTIRKLILPPASPEEPRSRSPKNTGGASSSGVNLPFLSPQSIAETVGYPSPAAPSEAGTINYPSPASPIPETLGYPSPERNEEPELPIAEKRQINWSPDVMQKKVRKVEGGAEEQGGKEGQKSRASSSNEPILPLRREEDEDEEDDKEEKKERFHFVEGEAYDDFEFALWTDEILNIANVDQDHFIDCEANARLAHEATRAYSVMSPATTKDEIAVEGSLALCHEWLGANLKENDFLVYQVTAEGVQQPVIEKELTGLTKEELKQNAIPVAAAKFKEILGLKGLKCFERWPRSKSFNRVDVRWVITWKMIDGIRQIKCRLTMRGFKDRQQSMDTYAGTTSRSGQRLVNGVVAQEPDWELFSIDVTQAFAKGLTFEQMARLMGTQLRAVEFELPASDSGRSKGSTTSTPFVKSCEC